MYTWKNWFNNWNRNRYFVWKNMLSYVITIYLFQRYANKMLVKKVFLILWNLQCFNWLSTVDEITSLLKCILQIWGIFAMIYFSLFLKSYFNFSIFSRKKKKKNPDRNDVCVRHNVFRIVKIAFVKKKLYYRCFLLPHNSHYAKIKDIRCFDLFFDFLNLYMPEVFHKTIILRSTCSVLLYI